MADTGVVALSESDIKIADSLEQLRGNVILLAFYLRGLGLSVVVHATGARIVRARDAQLVEVLFAVDVFHPAWPVDVAAIRDPVDTAHRGIGIFHGVADKLELPRNALSLMADLVVVLVLAVRFYGQVINVYFLVCAVSDNISSVGLRVERKGTAVLLVILTAPYVDDLSVFVRVAVDRPNAVARLLVLFKIEQGADGIPVCILCIGSNVLEDELTGRAVVKQVADVADDVAVLVDACGAKIARGAKANDELVEADRWLGRVVRKGCPRSNAQCRGFGQACKRR